MTDSLELDIAIKRAGIKRKDVADALGLTLTGFFNKLHNKTEFKLSEISAICSLLCLSSQQRDKIFFAANVD